MSENNLGIVDTYKTNKNHEFLREIISYIFDSQQKRSIHYLQNFGVLFVTDPNSTRGVSIFLKKFWCHKKCHILIDN